MFVFTQVIRLIVTGRIILGSSREADIQLSGSGVEFVHCIIENAGGSVTLHPLSGVTCVDGIPLASPARLAQGELFILIIAMSEKKRKILCRLV